MRCVTVPATDARPDRDFLRLPDRVYAGDPHWVPPIDREVRRTLDAVHNPYFRHAGLHVFVTYRGGLPVARAVLVTDRRRIRDSGIAQFGYFEALPDEDAVDDLFGQLARHARRAGARLLEGPYDPHHYGEVGLQIDGFDAAPAFLQPHHRPEYAGLLEHAGLREVKRLHTRRNPDVARTIRERYPTRRLRTEMSGLVARPFDPARRERDLERMREVYEDAFCDNWRFLPVGADEYHYAARHLSVVTKPEHVTIVEAGDEPVAVLQLALDVNPALRRLGGRVGPLRWCRFLRDRSRVRDLIVVAVGIKQGWRGTAAIRLLFDAMCRIGLGARALETTWVSPENILVQRVGERLDLVRDRSYAVYALDLEARRA
jgi:hypothetical protein